MYEIKLDGPDNNVVTIYVYSHNINIADLVEDYVKRGYTFETKLIPCQGCKDEQPNQLAHMDFGGCLYQSSIPYITLYQ